MNNKKINLKNFFAINNSIFSMLIMVMLVGMGEKMSERFLPIYLLALGGSTVSIAFLNGMDNLLSALYSFPGGYLSNKIGYKNSLIVFTLIAMIGYALVIIFPTWQIVILAAFLFISWTAISLPAVMSLVSNVVPKNKRAMGVSIHSLVRRIPMALGPIVGGSLMSIYGTIKGMRIAFIIALIFAFISIIIVYFFVEDKQKNKESIKFLDMLKNIKGNLKILLISDILIRFAEQIPYAFVVVWVVENNGLTTIDFGILTTIEMITSVIIYIPVAYFADKNSKKPFVLTTFIFFTLFPLVLIFSKSFKILIFAFIIRGLKEFGEPTRKSMIMDFSPEDEKAGTFGIYYLIRDVIVSIAVFMSAFLWNISPVVNFLVAFLFGLLGTIYFAIFGKDYKNLINNK
ncbi:MFS transporter [Tepiditoga spiralis]|uniref:MFS transporter n=1 Tax=Tepiditoga spiralis TaxID=2108365 RepID=A0A7G1GBV3_9BACT|nr:MFS transporter [Tepiditoga spiralis]BBE31399.1 MFS transporter [Tepiditoga spiralis]